MQGAERRITPSPTKLTFSAPCQGHQNRRRANPWHGLKGAVSWALAFFVIPRSAYEDGLVPSSSLGDTVSTSARFRLFGVQKWKLKGWRQVEAGFRSCCRQSVQVCRPLSGDCEGPVLVCNGVFACELFENDCSWPLARICPRTAAKYEVRVYRFDFSLRSCEPTACISFSVEGILSGAGGVTNETLDLKPCRGMPFACKRPLGKGRQNGNPCQNGNSGSNCSVNQVAEKPASDATRPREVVR